MKINITHASMIYERGKVFMKKIMRKRITIFTLCVLLSLIVMVTAAAATSMGGVHQFTEDSITYYTYSTVEVTSRARAYQTLIATTARPAGYLRAQAVLLDQYGNLIYTVQNTNTSSSTSLFVYTNWTYSSGTYWAHGGADVWRNGAYSSFYISGESPQLTLS